MGTSFKGEPMSGQSRATALEKASFSHVMGWSITIAVLNLIGVLFLWIIGMIIGMDILEILEEWVRFVVLAVTILWVLSTIGACLMYSRKSTAKQFGVGTFCFGVPFIFRAVSYWIVGAAVLIAVSNPDAWIECGIRAGKDGYDLVATFLIIAGLLCAGLFELQIFRSVLTVSNYACNRSYKPYNPHATLIMIISIGVYAAAVIGAFVLWMVTLEKNYFVDFAPIFWGVLLGGIPTMMFYVSLARFLGKIPKLVPIVQKKKRLETAKKKDQ